MFPGVNWLPCCGPAGATQSRKRLRSFASDGMERGRSQSTSEMARPRITSREDAGVLRTCAQCQPLRRREPLAKPTTPGAEMAFPAAAGAHLLRPDA
jgi:hypothetical protein